MDELTKITLSDPELEKVMNQEWILTKRRVIERVHVLLSREVSVINDLFSSCAFASDEAIISSSPKIYKGENYLSFPYVTLDYPAVFTKDNIFALRTMFWWGNFFSVTLQLSGKYKDAYIENISKNLLNENKQFFICIAENEWQHHFEQNNYLPAHADLVEQLQLRPFIKIALKYDLKHWNKMPQLLHEGYKSLINLLKD